MAHLMRSSARIPLGHEEGEAKAVGLQKNSAFWLAGAHLSFPLPRIALRSLPTPGGEQRRSAFAMKMASCRCRDLLQVCHAPVAKVLWKQKRWTLRKVRTV